MPRGRSATSARSDNSEMDNDGTAESEVAKLQRQFRIMDGDQQAYNLQAREHLRKQQHVKENLLKELEELQLNLAACKRFSLQQQKSKSLQILPAMLEQGNTLEEELEKEQQCQKRIEKEASIELALHGILSLCETPEGLYGLENVTRASIDIVITNMQLKPEEMRKGMVSNSDTQRSKVRRTQKALRILDYKLNRELICFSEQLTKNSHLREELQILHIEHVRFQQLQNRIDKQLHDVGKKTGEIVSLSTSAYDARLEAQSKMTMMKEKAVKDLVQYNAEIKDLERVIAHECCLKEFMSTKCSERSGQDDDHDLEHKQSSELKEQRRIDSGEESLEALEEMFERIHAVTGEDDLDMLANRFIQVEDRNFALFNFVNEQNSEAERLRDQISQIRAEIEQFQVAGLQLEEDHKSLLRDIEEQKEKTESKSEDYDNQGNIISKVLDEIKTGVNSILSNMECDRSVIEDSLGSSTGISENNIMSYLGLVEQRTNELLSVQAFLSSKDQEKECNPKDLAKFLLGQNPELLQQNISIQPAMTSVDYDAEESPVTDVEERPLSQEELRKRIIKGKESSDRQTATKASKISQQFDGRRRSLEEEEI